MALNTPPPPFFFKFLNKTIFILYTYILIHSRYRYNLYQQAKVNSGHLWLSCLRHFGRKGGNCEAPLWPLVEPFCRTVKILHWCMLLWRRWQIYWPGLILLPREQTIFSECCLGKISFSDYKANKRILCINVPGYAWTLGMTGVWLYIDRMYSESQLYFQHIRLSWINWAVCKHHSRHPKYHYRQHFQ